MKLCDFELYLKDKGIDLHAVRMCDEDQHSVQHALGSIPSDDEGDRRIVVVWVNGKCYKSRRKVHNNNYYRRLDRLSQKAPAKWQRLKEMDFCI